MSGVNHSGNIFPADALIYLPYVEVIRMSGIGGLRHKNQKSAAPFYLLKK
jgi:hypothetical protein